MEAIAHGNLALFPLVIIAVIYGDSLRMGSRDVGSRLFRLVAAASFGTIVLEFLTWIPDGAAFPFARLLLNASMTAYLLLSGSVCLLWLLYILVKARGLSSASDLRRPAVLCALAYAPYALVVLATPWTGLLFTVDEANVYHRGALYAVPYAFMGAVMVLGAALALRRWSEERRAEYRRSYLFLALFGVLPIVGLAVQQAWLEWWLAWPFVALSILLAYVNIQNVQGMVDALTGLGNRALLDRRLEEAWGRRGADGPWCLVMVDADDFKSVNDRFGHAFGDEVLCLIADDLRETFGDVDAIVSRFGGDEFAVLAYCDGEEELPALLGRLHEAMEATAERLAPRPFSFSVGAAVYDPASQRGFEDVVAEADRALYRCKASRRRGAPPSPFAAEERMR